MVANTTLNRAYPLPAATNNVSDDVTRLIAATNAIDTDMQDAFGSLAGKANSVHTHTIADISSLTATLDAKADVGHSHAINDLSDVDITGAPANRPLITQATGIVGFGAPLVDAAHSHAITDVTGLSSALAAKAALGGDANQSFTVQKLLWEGGIHQINNNDGGGNVNVRFGHEYSAGDKLTHAGGAVHMTGTIDAVNASFSIKLGANGVSGAAVVWGPALNMTYAGAFTWDGQAIWHAGNAATTAQAIAGTNNTLGMTPLTTAQAIAAQVPIGPDYESPEQTISAGSGHTLAHGFTAAPSSVEVWFVCKTAQSGIIVGQEIQWTAGWWAGNSGMVVAKDATNIKIRHGTNANGLAYLDLDTGASVTLLFANFTMIVRAWK